MKWFTPMVHKAALEGTLITLGLWVGYRVGPYLPLFLVGLSMWAVICTCTAMWWYSNNRRCETEEALGLVREQLRHVCEQRDEALGALRGKGYREPHPFLARLQNKEEHAPRHDGIGCAAAEARYRQQHTEQQAEILNLRTELCKLHEKIQFRNDPRPLPHLIHPDSAEARARRDGSGYDPSTLPIE